MDRIVAQERRSQIFVGIQELGAILRPEDVRGVLHPALRADGYKILETVHRHEQHFVAMSSSDAAQSTGSTESQLLPAGFG